MSYIVPSVQVLQTLANPGGVLASTPDLNTVIVGPLYNVIRAELNDTANATKSKVDGFDSFIYQDSGTLGYLTLPIPHKVLGQKLDTSSVKFVLKNAYVKVNDFTCDLSSFETADPLTTATLPAATSVEYAMTSLTLDGDVSIKKGDRIKYTVSVGSTPVDRVTSVRSVNTSTGVVVLSNAVGTIDAEQTAVIFQVYRLVPVLTLEPTSLQTDFTSSDTAYTVKIADNISGWPDHDDAYHVIDLVESIHLGYRALRVDLSQTVLDIEGELDRESRLGEASAENPLSLGVQLALANTVGIIKALSISENTSEGYAIAKDILESDNSVYALVPLTMEDSILATYATHVKQMSTPEEGAWRVLVCSTALPTQNYLAGSATAPAAAYVRQVTVGSVTYFIDPDVDFLAAGVVSTDMITVNTFGIDEGDNLPTGTVPGDFIGSWQVVAVIDSNTVQVEWADGTYDFNCTNTSQSNGQFLPYYVYRNMTVAEQAKYVKLVSQTAASNRVWNIMPDSVSVMINGVETPNMPGYYLAAAHAGMVAGFPVQQGFTNIGVAGIADLQHANYYFSRTNLNSMAEGGTCLYVQAVQGGTPYCRHALTTDVSVLEYREQLKVKNWDFLSYFYRDKLKSFIGTWNITPEMLNTVRATIIAGSELLMSQKKPKIGPPLLSYNIVTLQQNPVNKDRVTIKIRVELVSPANYFDVELEI